MWCFYISYGFHISIISPFINRNSTAMRNCPFFLFIHLLSYFFTHGYLFFPRVIIHYCHYCSSFYFFKIWSHNTLHYVVFQLSLEQKRLNVLYFDLASASLYSRLTLLNFSSTLENLFSNTYLYLKRFAIHSY